MPCCARWRPPNAPASAIMGDPPGRVSAWPRSTAGSCEDADMTHSPTRLLAPLLLALVVLAPAACHRDAGGDAGTAGVLDAGDAFARTEAEWRAQREERLLAPDGWTSLVGLHWIDQGPHYVGSSASSGIRLSMGPPELGVLTLADGKVRFKPARGAGITID